MSELNFTGKLLVCRQCGYTGGLGLMKIREHRYCLSFDSAMEKMSFLECIFKLCGNSAFFKYAH